HRDLARNDHQAGYKGRVRRSFIRADRKNFPLSRRRGNRHREEQGCPEGRAWRYLTDTKTQVMDMFSKSKNALLLVGTMCFLACTLSACSSKDDELDQFIADTKKEPGGRVEP